MTSLRRLCFINDQPCGLGREIFFIWHRLALAWSGSCTTTKPSNFVALKGVKSSAPYSERCIYNYTPRIQECTYMCQGAELLKTCKRNKKSHLLMKHLSFILLGNLLSKQWGCISEWDIYTRSGLTCFAFEKPPKITSKVEEVEFWQLDPFVINI